MKAFEAESRLRDQFQHEEWKKISLKKRNIGSFMIFFWEWKRYLMVDLTFTAKVIFPRIAKTSKIEGERWKTQAHLVKFGGQLIFVLTGGICN